jgi:arginase
MESRSAAGRQRRDQRLDLIGVPFNSAGTTEGVARGPAALGGAGLGRAIRDAGFEVVDVGDLDLPPLSPVRDAQSQIIATAAIAPMIRAVNRAVTASLESDAFPLVLGGDCPVLLGCLSAIATRQRPRLLFFDGHEDAWPADRSTTGEAADMELGWLLGLCVEMLPSDLRLEIPSLDADDVIVLGPRDEEELADAGIGSIEDSVRIVRPLRIEADPSAVATWAIETLGARGQWWLHVDLDVLSTDSLAAVDYPQAGGLGWATLTELTAHALASPDVLGWTLTIYNPDLDPDGAGATRIVEYVADSLRQRQRSLGSA